MIAHNLKIGERIYDTQGMRWGKILLIAGKPEDTFVENKEDIILYKPDNSRGNCKTFARYAYPFEPNYTFFGSDVCFEINSDEFGEDHDYDFYCPDCDENCWDFECESE